MQRKKSRFWTFIFSFVPGAGEMYMGFMKMGLSLMLGFMILVAIVGYTNLGILSVFPVALYIYSFFHANNLSSLDDMMFHNIEDQYLFGFDGIENMKMKLEGRNRKIAALILIVLGVIMLWQVAFNVLCDIFGWDNRFLSAIYYFMRDELPRVVIGIGVIWAGLALIRGKRIGIDEVDQDDSERSAYGDSFMDNERSAYRDPFMDNRRPAYREPSMDNGQPLYNEQSGTDGYPKYQGVPVDGGQNAYQSRERIDVQPEDSVQMPADGSVIYAQGPVADLQNVTDNTSRKQQIL